jgi:hypothetical protein
VTDDADIGVPREVDFAARYWAGDWTEGDIGRRREAWVVGEDDDPIFVWRSDDGPFTVLMFGPNGTSHTYAELDRKGEQIVMTQHLNDGTEQSYVMEVDDSGVVMEISAGLTVEPDENLTREEHEFEQGWDYEPPERELPGEEP